MLFLLLALLVIFVLWMGNFVLPRLNARDAAKRVAAPSEEQLEKWIDAFDAVLDPYSCTIEDVDARIFEAIEAADRKAPQPVWDNKKKLATYAKAYRYPSERLRSSGVLPGEPGGIGVISAGDGMMILKDQGYILKMTTEEWIRQGRPSGEKAIRELGGHKAKDWDPEDQVFKNGTEIERGPVDEAAKYGSWMEEVEAHERAFSKAFGTPDITVQLLNQGIISADHARAYLHRPQPVKPSPFRGYY